MADIRLSPYNPGVHLLELKIIPPLQVLIVGASMWLVHENISFLHFHSGYEYLVSRLILVLCLIVFLAAVYEFWRHQTTINPIKVHNSSSLITRGIYSWSRNPVYVADFLLLLAWVVWIGNWLNLVWLAAFVAYINRFQIEPEEAALRTIFGEAYSAYCRQTRRWI